LEKGITNAELLQLNPIPSLRKVVNKKVGNQKKLSPGHYIISSFKTDKIQWAYLV
jgi:hypothetical protein